MLIFNTASNVTRKIFGLARASISGGKGAGSLDSLPYEYGATGPAQCAVRWAGWTGLISSAGTIKWYKYECQCSMVLLYLSMDLLCV